MAWIDIHTHLVPYSGASGYPQGIAPEDLIAAMDGWGVGQAVVLPLESPECDGEYAPSAQTFDICAQFPERLIPFVDVDPRAQRAGEKLRHYAARGARGFGEHKLGLAIDDPRSMKLYDLCGELALPILFHMDPDLNWDQAGLPGLARVLKAFPQTALIGHGPGWWSAISADDDRKGGYPKGPIKASGALDRLLAECPNLYADISAGSGNNALTRDPAFTEGFLERHWRKLILGTDYFLAGQNVPQIEWLKTYPMPEEWREAIGRGNAGGLLKPLGQGA
jgi:predicted TIM-barrel fold metal-dependent hydrolase